MYVIRMPGGLGGGGHETPPYPDSMDFSDT